MVGYNREEVMPLDCTKLQSAGSSKKIMSDEAALYDRLDTTFSVDDAVDRAGYGAFQMRLIALAGLGWFSDAIEIIILSLIGDFVACEWVLKRWHIAVLTSSVFGGLMIGSPIFGTIADKYGRKKSLAISMTLILLFGAISAASPSYVWMVVFRFCTGFALGGVVQGMTLCSEYLPSSIRGKSGFYLGYFWSLGTFGVILLAWVVMGYFDNWRILLVIASVPALISIIAIKWYPESARYFLVSNQYERAKKLLEQMAQANGKDLPPGKLVDVQECGSRGRVMDLVGSRYRRSTLLFWYIWLAIAFSYYGIALISPIIIQNGKLPTGLIVFTFLIEHCNRKVLLGSSCFISGILILLLLVQTENHIVILVFLFGARAVILAIFQLIFVMTSEAFPTTLRAIAMGSSSSFCRLGGLVVPYVAQVLIIQNAVAAVSLLGGVVLLAGVATAFLPLETRGRHMQESHSPKS